MRLILTLILFFVTTAAPAGAQEGAQQFEKFNLQGYTDGGAKSWDVKGDTAQVEGDIVKMQNVEANHYGPPGQQVNLTAQSGQLNKTSGSVHLEKDVVITAQASGGTLTTDYLDWDKKNDLVKTDAAVKITDPSQGMTATGTGLKAHPNLQTAQMNEDVTVIVKDEKTQIQKVVITSDGPMEIDQKKSRATFSKNVVAIEADRTLKADLMEVFFDPVTNRIKEAVCTGNVQILQGGNVTHSDKAVYNATDQTLTLVGRPKLIMEMNGKSLMPSLKDSKDKK